MKEFASSFDVKTNKETERFQTLFKTWNKIPVLIVKKVNSSLDVVKLYQFLLFLKFHKKLLVKIISAKYEIQILL